MSVFAVSVIGWIFVVLYICAFFYGADKKY